MINNNHGINDDNMRNEDDDNDNGNAFMKSLQSRIQNLQDKETKLPLVVLDSMLPRQVLTLEIRNKMLLSLVEQRITSETPTLGMLGKAILQTGETVTLNKGVEVEIGIDDSRSNHVQFKAKRRFRLEGEIENTDEGWTEGRVSFLSSKDEEEEEMLQKLGSENPVSSVANAISRAKEITSPNLNMPNHSNLINRWIELAKENERQPGQIDRLIEDLGGIPKDNEPTEMAFWIGSLINPLPAMGVAREIRPALLMAESAEDRINIAYDGILRSVKHMDGSAKMW